MTELMPRGENYKITYPSATSLQIELSANEQKRVPPRFNAVLACRTGGTMRAKLYPDGMATYSSQTTRTSKHGEVIDIVKAARLVLNNFGLQSEN